MSTGKNGEGHIDEAEGAGSDPKFRPGAFSEEEIASVTEGPRTDPELDDVEAATIEEEGEPDLESSFEKLVARSKKLSPEKIRTVLQSVLFVSDRPLNLEELFQATGIERELITDGMNKLAGDLRDGVSGIVLHEVANGWQLRTDAGSAEYVRRFLRVKPQRLTRAALETLAIIAYRQPVTRPEVEDIRGVDCGAVVKALLDRKLIKILGKRDEVGRPILYGTTKEFLEFFALKDLSSLPTLREFQELTEEHQEIVEKETAPKKGAEGTIAELADPALGKKLEEGAKEGEAALAELEKAIDTADARSKEAAQIFGAKPQQPAADDDSPPQG